MRKTKSDPMERPSIPTLAVYTSPVFKYTPAEFIELYEGESVSFFQIGTPYLSDDVDGWLHGEMAEWLRAYRREGGTMRPMLGMRTDLVTTRLDADSVSSGQREVNERRAAPFALRADWRLLTARWRQLRAVSWGVHIPRPDVLPGRLRYAYPVSGNQVHLRCVHATPELATSEAMAQHWLNHANALEFATGLYPGLYVGVKRHLHSAFDYGKWHTARAWAESNTDAMPWRFGLPGPEYSSAAPFIRPPYTAAEYDRHVQDTIELVLRSTGVGCAVIEENPWGWPGGQRTRWMREGFYARVQADEVWGADARTV